MIAADFLIDAGFEVIEAEHAAEAVAILERTANAIQILFTDVHMPGAMDGFALAQLARRNWPWLKVLVASGKARPAGAELPEGSLFLEKPYTLQQVVDYMAVLTESDS